MNGGPKVCQIWTLDRIREERVEEEGDCWLWLGALSGPGKTTPLMHFRNRLISAYSAVWLLKTGCEHVPEGMRFWRSCLGYRCVSPKHIKFGTHAQMKSDLAARGAYVCTPSRKAKITSSIRRERSKLKGGMAEAREIRASNDSEKILSERHGISISRIYRIKAGKAWRETVLPTASIFNMGGA